MPVADSFRICNKAVGNGNCQCPEKDCPNTGNKKTVRKRRLYRGLHPFVIAGGVVISDQRKRSLCHALRDVIGQKINLFFNAHARDSSVGISCDHVIECRVGDCGHHGHHKTGQARRSSRSARFPRRLSRKHTVGNTPRYHRLHPKSETAPAPATQQQFRKAAQPPRPSRYKTLRNAALLPDQPYRDSGKLS
jgi:hypothetical protein